MSKQIKKSIPDLVTGILGPDAVGDFLGQGDNGRQAFTHKQKQDTIIKIDPSVVFNNYSSNCGDMFEWETAFNAKHPIADWLAPCTWMSDCHLVMFQRKCTPATFDDIPSEVPAYLFQETPKLNNYGLLDGRFVCFDYPGLGADLIIRSTLEMKAVEPSDFSYSKTQGDRPGLHVFHPDWLAYETEIRDWLDGRQS